MQVAADAYAHSECEEWSRKPWAFAFYYWGYAVQQQRKTEAI